MLLSAWKNKKRINIKATLRSTINRLHCHNEGFIAMKHIMHRSDKWLHYMIWEWEIEKIKQRKYFYHSFLRASKLLFHTRSNRLPFNKWCTSNLPKEKDMHNKALVHPYLQDDIWITHVKFSISRCWNRNWLKILNTPYLEATKTKLRSGMLA